MGWGGGGGGGGGVGGCGSVLRRRSQYLLKSEGGWGRQLPTQQGSSGPYLAEQKGNVCAQLTPLDNDQEVPCT